MKALLTVLAMLPAAVGAIEGLRIDQSHEIICRAQPGLFTREHERLVIGQVNTDQQQVRELCQKRDGRLRLSRGQVKEDYIGAQPAEAPGRSGGH
jgi:hypothetical protein